MLTDDDLQRAFRLIHGIHPDRAVAQCILQDAYDRIPLIQKLQERRPASLQPFKFRIPEENLLQFAVYLASEAWEKDQESAELRKEPKYHPTQDDRLIRYIKTLIWKATDRRACYTAVSIGCLLYTYQPHEISALAEEHFDSDNIRRVKGWVTEQVKARFRRAKGFRGPNGHIELKTPTERQKALIQRSLYDLAPWAPCHGIALMPSCSLLEIFFDKGSKKSEWERIHVLVDPKCGGLPQLVREYNATYRKGNNMQLDDPGGKLKAPKFDDELQGPLDDDGSEGPPDPRSRFDPPKLDHNEISSLKHSFERNQQRRKDYRLSTLYVYVDGARAATLTQDTFLSSFTIPHTASCIEVFGDDEDGELLLGVFPLSYAEDEDGSPERKLRTAHEGGQAIEITIAKVSDDGGDAAGALAWIEYSEPVPRATTVADPEPQGANPVPGPEGHQAGGLNILTDGAQTRAESLSRPTTYGRDVGILSAIGNTPLVELSRVFSPAHFRLFAKLEFLNPGGSMKDRPALKILWEGLKSGLIGPNTLVVESSSGNMGVGLAQACSYYGLRFVCVIDPKTTAQNIRLMRAYGAEIDLVKEPDPVTGEYLHARLNRTAEIVATTPESFWPNQYANLHNPSAHHLMMHEVVSALEGEVDYLFCVTSTCGTLRGCAEYVREHGMKTKIIAVDAVGSVIFGGERAKRLIPGHGAAIIPPLFRPDLADACVHVTDAECIAGCRRLTRAEAILAGGSSGAIITAIDHYRHNIPRGATCVAILPDRGERYLDTIYADDWVGEHFGSVSHLLERDTEHPLTEVIYHGKF